LKERHKEGLTGIGGRRRKQLLDNLKEKREDAGNLKMKH
jgi:hypothetical protein